MSRKLIQTALLQAPKRMQSTAPKPRANYEKLEGMCTDFMTEQTKEDTLFPEHFRDTDNRSTITFKNSDKKILDFSKNSYMGYNKHPEVIEAGIEALKKYGGGIGCSRAGSGTYDIHKEVEDKLRRFHKRDETWDAALLSSGFMSNIGSIPALLNKEDAVVSDQYAHGCMVNGSKLSGATRERYAHRNMEQLEELLAKNQDKRIRLITTDGFFSMFGWCTNLPKIRELADKYQAVIYLDDSHALGSMGKEGRGTEDHQNCMGVADIISGSLSKGFTPQGGYLVAKKSVISKIRQRAPSYVQTVSIPAMSAAMIGKCVDLATRPEADITRAHISKLSTTFSNRMQDAGFIVEGEIGLPTVITVFPDDVYPNGHSLVMPFGRKLIDEHGVMVLSTVYPSSPSNRCRMRMSFVGYHTEEEVDRLCDAYIAVGRDMNIIK